MQVFNDVLGISVSHCISDDVHNKKNCYDMLFMEILIISKPIFYMINIIKAESELIENVIL